MACKSSLIKRKDKKRKINGEMNMKKWCLVTVMVLMLSTIAMADVIMLHDGNIYLGKITSTDSNGIVIETFGQSLTISQSDIFKSEKNFDSFKDVTTDIILRDGSLIKGKIQNYDEEVGINVNIDFGTITLPVQSIKEISDPVKKKYYNGAPVNIGFTGGYYMPYSGLASDYNSNYNFSIFAEFDSKIIRGLSFGGELSTVLMDYKVDDSDFSIYTLQPYAIYKFLQLRKEPSFLRLFVPFVSAGMGGAYIVKETSSTEKSEVDLVGNLKIGIDVNLTESIIARFNTGSEIILQKNTNFNRAYFNAGLMYSF